MKKLNFNNQDTGDDKHLIRLLKTANLQEPSEQFVNQTLLKLKERMQANSVHKPLKFPLLIMGILFVFLVSPLIFTALSGVTFTDPLPEINPLIKTLAMEFNIWFMLIPLSLLLAMWVFINSVFNAKDYRSQVH